MKITDHAYVIHQGKILVEGGVDEIRNNQEAKRIYLGDTLEMDSHLMGGAAPEPDRHVEHEPVPPPPAPTASTASTASGPVNRSGVSLAPPGSPSRGLKDYKNQR